MVTSLLLTSDGSITINPSLYPSMSYDPLKDLLPIFTLASVPLVMVFNAAVPVHSMKEFIA
jgi:tripartite-type tricarboxylate transporter receptor subunit TctC